MPADTDYKKQIINHEGSAEERRQQAGRLTGGFNGGTAESDW